MNEAFYMAIKIIIWMLAFALGFWFGFMFRKAEQKTKNPIAAKPTKRKDNIDLDSLIDECIDHYISNGIPESVYINSSSVNGVIKNMAISIFFTVLPEKSYEYSPDTLDRIFEDVSDQYIVNKIEDRLKYVVSNDSELYSLIDHAVDHRPTVNRSTSKPKETTDTREVKRPKSVNIDFENFYD